MRRPNAHGREVDARVVGTDPPSERAQFIVGAPVARALADKIERARRVELAA